MPNVTFSAQGITTSVVSGTTILDAARQVSVLIESPCNAIGTCGKCKVQVDNLAHIEYQEGRHHLSAEETANGYVLSCQAKVNGDITVTIGNTADQNKTLKILSEGQSFAYSIKNHITKHLEGNDTIVFVDGEEIGRESGDTTSQLYGLSIDIGTTTVVAALVDLRNGKEIASISALNPQSLHAQDVLTRITFASTEAGLRTMYDDITALFNRMIKELARESGIDTTHIYEVVYSGNTTMIHLACHENPQSLGKYPYTPKIVGGNTKAADMLCISPFSMIYLPPIISAYVGPDITSGILASQLHNRQGTILFIDIGTNGEMVIARDGKLAATSTAAGPAFEGMNITFGMRAGNGALESFEIDDAGDIQTRTIGGVMPTGICGSGLLDIVGELVSHGIVGANGKFASPEKDTYSGKLKEKLIIYEGKPAFEVADGIYITQKDIRQVQLAKGAVRAGVEALLQNLSISSEDVDTVEIAGSFGYHLREKSLINIGLLPRDFAGKVDFVGNTSKTGGRAFLLNTDFRDEMKALVQTIDCVELANKDGFEKIFVKALSFDSHRDH